MENIIRKHIEELCQAEGHEALKENYEDSKQDIAGCVKYINEEARKVIKGQCGHVDDEIVYGWAVHYFVEKLYNAKTLKAKAEPKAKKVDKAPEPKAAPKKAKVQPVAQPVAEPAENFLFDFIAL